MGYQLTGLVLSSVCARLALTANERLVLAVMASRAIDDDKDPYYSAGTDALALSLAGDITDASRQSVKRALMGLRKKGLIDLLEQSAPGHRMTYLLNIRSFTLPVDNSRSDRDSGTETSYSKPAQVVEK